MLALEELGNDGIISLTFFFSELTMEFGGTKFDRTIRNQESGYERHIYVVKYLHHASLCSDIILGDLDKNKDAPNA